MENKTSNAIQRELEAEKQRHEARKAEILQQAERRELEYKARMAGIDDAERIATDAVKAGFDAQRKQLEAEFNADAESPPETNGAMTQPSETDGTLRSEIAAINQT